MSFNFWMNRTIKEVLLPDMICKNGFHWCNPGQVLEIHTPQVLYLNPSHKSFCLLVLNAFL